MPYGNKTKKTYRKTAKKYVKKTYKKRPAMSKKGIKTMIKKEIASNVENKISGNVAYSASTMNIVQQVSTAPILSYAVWCPYNNSLFSIAQGVSESNRIGNVIKLKRWVIKGTLYADPAFDASSLLAFPQNQMYVDLYFGRKLNMQDAVDDQLTDFYQNGSSSYTPEGQITERLYSVNKDQYKIYWHKKYKIGPASQTMITPSISNNDYQLNREFGFDVCKLVCKNKKIKYNDGSNVANDTLLESLTLWCVVTLPNNNIDTTLTPTDPTTYYSPVRIQANTYIEYEDA